MDIVNWNKLSQQAFQHAYKNGLTGNHEFSFDLMMIITELGEAVNADKKGKSADRVMFEKNFDTPQVNPEKHWVFCYETFIKDTLEDELADAFIAMLTFSEQWNEPINTFLYNETFMSRAINLMKRKKHFPVQIHAIVSLLINRGELDLAALRLIGLCNHLQIDLLWHIEQKMKYNEMRPYKHGKKY